MSKTMQRGPVDPAMNITPMIDVIFLLIIFFMLITKIVTEEAILLVVPVAEVPQVHKLPEENRLVVNVGFSKDIRYSEEDNEKRLAEAHKGLDFGNAKKIVPDEKGLLKAMDWNQAADQVGYIVVGSRRFSYPDQMVEFTQVLEAEKATGKEREVVLRADMGMSYQNIMPVIAAITNAQITMANLSAFAPDK